MARGLGEIQNNERMLTNYKIIGALYLQPYTYEQLRIATKIHRNTLRQRLDQLVNDDIIIKHSYNFSKYTVKYHTRRDFYLLNWANKQSREMVDYIFGSKRASFIVDPNIPKARILSSYEINSIDVKSNRRKYHLMEPRTIAMRMLIQHPWGKSVEKLCSSERDIFEQLRSFIEKVEPNSSRIEAVIRDKLELIEKRDSIFESIVASCIPKDSQFKNYRYTSKFFFLDLVNFSFLDLLIDFTTEGLYDYSRPYMKFWDIIERIQNLIID